MTPLVIPAREAGVLKEYSIEAGDLLVAIDCYPLHDVTIAQAKTLLDSTAPDGSPLCFF